MGVGERGWDLKSGSLAPETRFLGSASLAPPGACSLTAFGKWEPHPLLVYQPEGGNFQIMTISVHSSKIC